MASITTTIDDPNESIATMKCCAAKTGSKFDETKAWTDPKQKRIESCAIQTKSNEEERIEELIEELIKELIENKTVCWRACDESFTRFSLWWER